MNRFACTIIGAAVFAAALGSGCLITDSQTTGSGECCYQYEVCDTYCDPYGNCDRDCTFQESCPSTCEADGGPVDSSTDESCFSDVDCNGDQICVGNHCKRPDTDDRGAAGLCQACETNSDCIEADALCVQLRNGQDGPPERVCTTPCAGGCPSGFECETIAGSSQCLPESNADDIRTCADAPDLECVTAGDCETGQSCVNNHCKAPETAECTADSDCGDGQVCHQQECIAECVSRSDCASGQLCKNGSCVGGADNCVFNNECSGDGLCVNGSCFASCTDSSDCANLEHCRQGVCRTTECRGTADCAGDEVCIDAACQPACSSDADCATGYQCTQYGYCDRDPSVACRTTAECASDEICLDGDCRAACSCNQDCAAGAICDTDSHACVDDAGQAPSTCESSCDCTAGQICNDSGQCVGQ